MIVLKCDGCAADLPAHAHDAERHGRRESCSGCRQGHEHATRGRLDPTLYCPGCATTFDAADAEIEAARVEAIDAFEAFRTARLAAARVALARLPDE